MMRSEHIYTVEIRAVLSHIAKTLRTESDSRAEAEELADAIGALTDGKSNFAVLGALAAVFESVLNRSLPKGPE